MIPLESALDAWLWDVVQELVGFRDPWVQPPFKFKSAVAGVVQVQPTTSSKIPASIAKLKKKSVDTDEAKTCNTPVTLSSEEKVNILRSLLPVEIKCASAPTRNIPVLILLCGSGSAYFFVNDAECEVFNF